MATPTMPGMGPAEEDLYGDGSTPMEPTAPTENVESGEEQTPANETAVLPRDFAGQELTPGDTLTVKVLRVNDDSVEVEMQSQESPPAAEPAPMMMEGGEMGEMGEYE